MDPSISLRKSPNIYFLASASFSSFFFLDYDATLEKLRFFDVRHNVFDKYLILVPATLLDRFDCHTPLRTVQVRVGSIHPRSSHSARCSYSLSFATNTRAEPSRAELEEDAPFVSSRYPRLVQSSFALCSLYSVLTPCSSSSLQPLAI